MPEWNYHICNLQANCIATHSNYEYKLSFSLEIILDFDKSFIKTCACRYTFLVFTQSRKPNHGHIMRA